MPGGRSPRSGPLEGGARIHCSRLRQQPIDLTHVQTPPEDAARFSSSSVAMTAAVETMSVSGPPVEAFRGLDGAGGHRARICSVGEAAAHGRYANGEHDEACEGEGKQVWADICSGPIE